MRLSVAVENYNHQHQDLRVENGVEYGDTIDKMDFPYLARVTKLNVAALAWLASAPPPPEPKAEGAVSTDTTVNWAAWPAPIYKIWRRRTDANNWEVAQGTRVPDCVRKPTSSNDIGGLATVLYCQVVLPHIRIDDWVFGVSSVSKDGFESPVASAVPGGAFKPWVALPPEPVKPR